MKRGWKWGGCQCALKTRAAQIGFSEEHAKQLRSWMKESYWLCTAVISYLGRAEPAQKNEDRRSRQAKHCQFQPKLYVQVELIDEECVITVFNPKQLNSHHGRAVIEKLTTNHSHTPKRHQISKRPRTPGECFSLFLALRIYDTRGNAPKSFFTLLLFMCEMLPKGQCEI